MSKYQFFNPDETVDRRDVPALKVHPLVVGEDGEDLFAAGVADMDFKASPVIINALQQRLEHGVFGYETLSDTLIPSLMHWLDTRHNWQVPKESILRAPNVLNSLAIATSLFTDEGDGVIVQPPVFFDFFDILHENKREVVLNPLKLSNGLYSMDFDDLEAKASNPEIKMIYLCNPHNPIARVWTKEELYTLGEICNQHSVLVVSDEMHGDLALPGHRYVPYSTLGPAFAENSITCLSPAKTFNIASCCSAFTIIFDDDRRQAFQVENSRLTVNKNNAFANAAMEAAFTGGEPWLNEVLDYLKGNVDVVRQVLSSIPNVHLIEPEGTFLLWIDFRELELSPDELTQFLRNNAKWAITRGHAFGEQGAGFARLNIACNREKLKNALEQLANAVSKFG